MLRATNRVQHPRAPNHTGFPCATAPEHIPPKLDPLGSSGQALNSKHPPKSCLTTREVLSPTEMPNSEMGWHVNRTQGLKRRTSSQFFYHMQKNYSNRFSDTMGIPMIQHASIALSQSWFHLPRINRWIVIWSCIWQDIIRSAQFERDRWFTME